MINTNNIEDIKFGSVVDNNNINYKEFRKQLTPKYWKVWIDILIGYILLITTFVIFITIEIRVNNLLLLVILGVLFGFIAAFWLAYIQLFIHEAAHYNIHSNKKTNDLLANIFIGAIVGVNIKPYRKTHWKHHVSLGQTDDTEHSYFEALSLTYIFKMLTGLHVMAVLKTRHKIENAQTKETIRQQKQALVIGLLINLIILSCLVFTGYYATAIVWVITVVIFYPFFATLRQLLEHRDENHKSTTNFFEVNHGKVNRLFKNSIFSHFFGGAGFNRHLIHHWDPQISYTRLKEVEQFLESTETCSRYIKSSKTTYLKTFIKLVRS